MHNLAAVVLLGLLFASPCHAAEKTNDWYADIHVWVGRAHNRLTIGQTAKATDGHNFGETPIPKTFLTGGVSSFFYHPEWKKKSPHFWQDIRALGKLPRTWEFTVKTQKPNVEVELSWGLWLVKRGIDLYLKRKTDNEYFKLRNKKIYIYKSAVTKTIFLLKAEQITLP